MNIARPKKIVVLGLMSHFPVAGVVWQTMHYLIGLQRLGYDVYYVESHGCAPTKLMRSKTDDGPARAAAYIKAIAQCFDFDGRWAYHALYAAESPYYGLTESQLNNLYRSAALIINLHGSHVPRPELTATNRLVYLETDPVDVQIDLHHQNPTTMQYLDAHCAHFSFGENLGNPDCKLPVSDRFRFRATRQPVVLDFWEPYGSGEAVTFTTIGNWRQPWRERQFNGEKYTWSKHFEFLKFIDLPQRTAQPLEVALSSYDETDQRILEAKGWRVRPALEFSRGEQFEAYRKYIGDSRGEFTVAKDQNVRLRSGWFSDRAVTYLAAGRPVITQETGFSNILPTGEGLFAFSTMDEIIAAIDVINADYCRQQRAALTLAHEYFSHEVVLKRLLAEADVCRRTPKPFRISESLVLSPTSRWPTRLPHETVQAVASWPVPVAQVPLDEDPPKVSIVIVTHNGLVYTKMCLTSLLLNTPFASYEVIVVDNASTDGTVEYLNNVAARNPRVRVIVNKLNRGFAAANNQGLAAARGEHFMLLNNDTILPTDWPVGFAQAGLDATAGLIGPVTNRTCNEAQIDAPYRTYAELEVFAHERAKQFIGKTTELSMLAMYCVGFRREVFERVGPLDESFGLGMFEDDDYAMRVRQAGYRIVCVEGAFIHHFGQASVGELCLTGDYDKLYEANRRRFEQKWGAEWKPHGRRITPEYEQLRQRVREIIAEKVPADARVIVVSKGDNELLTKNGWHFPQVTDGRYANQYPANGAAAVRHLEELRARGAGYFVLPKPAFWWLEHYPELREHLEKRGREIVKDAEICVVYALPSNALRIIVAGPPKTGNTWIEHLLATIYGLEIVQTYADLEQLRGFVQRGEFKNRAIAHNHFMPTAAFFEAIAPIGAHLVTVIRNPYDTFVSLYHFIQNFSDKSPRADDPARSMFGKPLDHPDVLQFLANDFRWHLEQARAWEQSGKSIVVRYEQLHGAPLAALRQLTERIEPVAEEILQRALIACAAPTMRAQSVEMEKHIRTATVGDWKNHLKPVHLRIFKERHADLICALGYEVFEETEASVHVNGTGNLDMLRGLTTERRDYEELIAACRQTAIDCVPPDAVVLVVSRGDDGLLQLPGRRAWHFPQADGGVYIGSHPASSAEAIAQIEALRAEGGEFLMFPRTSFWWLEHYAELRVHLERNYGAPLCRNETCVIFPLRQCHA